MTTMTLSNTCFDPTNKWTVDTQHPVVGYGIYGYYSDYKSAYSVVRMLRSKHWELEYENCRVVPFHKNDPMRGVHPWVIKEDE